MSNRSGVFNPTSIYKLRRAGPRPRDDSSLGQALPGSATAPPHNPAPPPAPSLCPAHLSPAAARASGLREVCVLFSSERRTALRPPPQPTLARRRGSPATTVKRGMPGGDRPTDPQTGAEGRGGRRRHVTGRDASVDTSALAALGHAHLGGLQACGCGVGVEVCVFPAVAGLLRGSFTVVASWLPPSPAASSSPPQAPLISDNSVENTTVSQSPVVARRLRPSAVGASFVFPKFHVFST